jgi:hypothetical protein
MNEPSKELAGCHNAINKITGHIFFEESKISTDLKRNRSNIIT